MSKNVEILAAFYEAFNRGAIDDALQYVDPDVVCHPGAMAPDAKAEYLGREAFREFLVTVAIGPWEGVALEPKEMIEAEDGRILSVDQWFFRGRDGIEIDRELPTLFTFREGLMVQIDGFTDKIDALKAAGLAE